jgi:hypothetical protein
MIVHFFFYRYYMRYIPFHTQGGRKGCQKDILKVGYMVLCFGRAMKRYGTRKVSVTRSVSSSKQSRVRCVNLDRRLRMKFESRW